MRSLILTIGVPLLLVSCVRKKIFQSEQQARISCEAREQVLEKELDIRRQEQRLLTDKVGGLNKRIGLQEAEIKDLQKELTDRTVKMGNSSTKLAQEKAAVENELANKTAQLNKAEYELRSIQGIQRSNNKILTDLRNELALKYPTKTGAAVSLEGNKVLLVLPDKPLFSNSGMNLSEAGKDLLKGVCNVLANKPTVNVLIEAHTDNKLPKVRGINDTWDWSLQRASNVLRTMITEYNVNANQLTPVGKGEFYPLASNETAEGRLKNRRTVLVMTPLLKTIPEIK